MSPRSCEGGSQLTITLSAVCCQRRSISAQLISRLRWLTMTPFGWPVEPEVYCKKAVESPAVATGSQSSELEPSAAIETSGAPQPAAGSSASPASWANIAGDVNASTACASSTMVRMRPSLACTWVDHAGTATTPA